MEVGIFHIIDSKCEHENVCHTCPEGEVPGQVRALTNGSLR